MIAHSHNGSAGSILKQCDHMTLVRSPHYPPLAIAPAAFTRCRCGDVPCNSESKFTLAPRVHSLLLGMSLVTVAGAAVGSHGFALFFR